MKKIATAAALGILLAPAFLSAEYGSLDGAFGPQIVGVPCSVRIYHVQFRFPPEGGKIIITPENELYFVRTYLFGCENAGAGFPVVVSSNSSFNPALQGAESYVNPRYLPSASGPAAYPQPGGQFLGQPASLPPPACSSG